MHIAWLNEVEFQQDPKGGLTSHLASARYRCIIPARELKPLAVECSILGNLKNVNLTELQGHWQKLNCDIAVVGKFFSPDMMAIAATARANGMRLIADYCDNRFDKPEIGPLYIQMAQMADCVVASTTMMAQIIKQYTGRDASIVPDPFEGPLAEPKFAPDAAALKLLWFGHPTNLDTLAPILGKLAKYAQQEQKLSLTIMTAPDPTLHEKLNVQTPHFSIQLAAWGIEELWCALQACDLVIIPSLANEKKLVKGANRLIEALCAGRPVVAYPLPSYQEFHDYCWLNEDIVQGIKAAMRDQALTLQKTAAGQNYIKQHYAPIVIAQKWRQVFAQLLAKPSAIAAPTITTDTPIRLNLGCGDKILPGYVNIDVVDQRAGKKPDIVCDLHKLTLPDNYADEVMAIHVVEHFWRWEVRDILKEWTRTLKPGGKMILECPNLITACTELLKDPVNAAGVNGNMTMWVFYGDPSWRDPLMCHRWAYTPDSLGALLHEVGLVNIRQEPAQYKKREPRDMRIVGEKPLQG
jgi:SAM-dependent methyltransferase